MVRTRCHRCGVSAEDSPQFFQLLRKRIGPIGLIGRMGRMAFSATSW